PAPPLPRRAPAPVRAAMGGSLRRPAASARGLTQVLDTDCTSQCMVIQDIANGWEGLCVGLQLQNASTTADLCRAACCADPKCEVWQWGNKREKASESSLGVCKTGPHLLRRSCLRSRDSGVRPSAALRMPWASAIVATARFVRLGIAWTCALFLGKDHREAFEVTFRNIRARNRKLYV
ncbi:unnamed protein product, partial [Prorocentrum cordatum]